MPGAGQCEHCHGGLKWHGQWRRTLALRCRSCGLRLLIHSRLWLSALNSGDCGIPHGSGTESDVATIEGRTSKERGR